MRNEQTNKQTNEHTNGLTERRKLYTRRHKCRGYKNWGITFLWQKQEVTPVKKFPEYLCLMYIIISVSIDTDSVPNFVPIFTDTPLQKVKGDNILLKL